MPHICTIGYYDDPDCNRVALYNVPDDRERLRALVVSDGMEIELYSHCPECGGKLEMAGWLGVIFDRLVTRH